ncbi:sensor histidine kinase [Lutibacter holmesii]|uniref:histidine kinase n=1 Tax=Lutibacter holmesii TaxID=1137985 RepID=A0ABW3WN14_9FLAO
MKKNQNKSANYIEELEDKIVELSLQLKSKNNQLQTIQEENFVRNRKVVHNLKNPIGVAYSFSEILASNGLDTSIEKFEKYVEVIKNSTDFSIQFLNALSKLNRLKSPSYALNLAKVEYVSLVKKVISEFNAEAETKQISISTKLPKNQIFVTLDKTEIETVISALIQNAIRFSPANTTISIEVVEHENYIETKVIDEGIGMSELDVTNIFKEFYVVNTYSENKEKCIGLGLAIVKLILDFHKGTIQVNSTLNKGTSFKFSIPK